MTHQCPTCKREFEDDVKTLTSVALSVKVRVAPGDIVLRSHVVDILQSAILEWLHENSFDPIEPTDSMEDVIDIVVAR
jgi:hypothetical protein